MILLVVQLGLTFVPAERVPPRIRPIYNALLAYRNKAVNRLGLPVSTFSDTVRVESGETNVQLYFAPSPAIEEALIAFIDSARTSVEVAVYDLDLIHVVDALIQAHQRDCMVRVIVDYDNFFLYELEPLKRAGIDVRHDRERKAIMHNKFVVVDGNRVWTGSYNFTENGTSKNDNNAITLDSELLAANYQTEFEEMWAGKFGAKSPPTTPNPHIDYKDMETNTYFAPEDEVMATILDQVSDAEVSLHLMAFSFTDQELARKLMDKQARGLDIQCLFDRRQAENAYSQDEALAAKGVSVTISPNQRGVMHHKVIIIDGHTVITGSFNFSNNADESNDENILIIHSVAIASAYEQEFQRCLNGTKGY